MILNKLDIFLQWKFIDKVSNSQTSKLVAALPLVGYLIVFNDQIAGIMSFDFIAGNSKSGENIFLLSGLAKLRLVFFGSIALLISNLVCQLFRPKELQFADNEFEFVTLVRENYTSTEIDLMEQRIKSTNWVKQKDFIWNAFEAESSQSGPYDPKRGKHFPSGQHVDLVSREWWAGQMKIRKPARLFCLLSGTVAYSMLLVPTLDILQAVARDMV